MLMRGRADFYLARRLRKAGGVPLGEVFSFVSALYFRGKLWRCCGRWSRTSAGGTAGARGSWSLRGSAPAKASSHRQY